MHCMPQHPETLVTNNGRFVTGTDIFATDNQHIFYSTTMIGRFHTHIGRFATQDRPHSHLPTNICYLRCFVASLPF